LHQEWFDRITPQEASPYVFGVSAKHLRGEILLHMAEDRGLLIGTGSACSSHAKNRYSKVILACGHDEKTADGVLRISFSPNSTEAEVVEAAAILNEIGQDLSKRMK
jgi:cysteine desulfurase